LRLYLCGLGVTAERHITRSWIDMASRVR